MAKTLQIKAHQQSQAMALTHDQQGMKLSEVLGQHGLSLNTRCGHKGLCDGCLIDVIDEQGKAKRVKACELVAGQVHALSIAVPARSLQAHNPQVVSNFKIKIGWANNPIVKLEHATQPALGVAIDIGTTTVALMLVELATGKVKGRASTFNKQMSFGDDVLTRINLCSTDPQMLGKLQHAVVADTIVPLVEQVIEKAEASVDQIACYAVAANTTMLHLLAGVDPSSMGVAPFTAGFLDHREVASTEIGLPGDAPVHLLPGAAAYVGADLVAGCLMTSHAYEERPVLLVDVGTNGEIIFKHGEHLIGCATAAGPAFEGSRLTSGMRAADGAIQRIRFADRHATPTTGVIGQTQACGVCGSAYLDFLSDARRVGLLNPAGRFVGEHCSFVADEYGRRIRLAGDNGDMVAISESDVASLLQAKAAIAAGIVTLMERVGMTPDQVARVYLAGGFGMHIDPVSAVGSGLLPGFMPEQIEAVGNTSLAGAYVVMLDQGIFDEMKHLAQRMQIVELNLEPMFEMNYIEHLSLP